MFVFTVVQKKTSLHTSLTRLTEVCANIYIYIYTKHVYIRRHAECTQPPPSDKKAEAKYKAKNEKIHFFIFCFSVKYLKFKSRSKVLLLDQKSKNVD